MNRVKRESWKRERGGERERERERERSLLLLIYDSQVNSMSHTGKEN